MCLPIPKNARKAGGGDAALGEPASRRAKTRNGAAGDRKPTNTSKIRPEAGSDALIAGPHPPSAP